MCLCQKPPQTGLDAPGEGGGAHSGLPPQTVFGAFAKSIPKSPNHYAKIAVFFARRRPPRPPDDLARHSCVQYRRAADGDVFAWPFKRNRKSRRISVDGRVMVDDPDLAVRAAVDGLGITYTIEAEPFLRSGQLVRVLEDWSPAFEGLFLYYPGHRLVPAALPALIDMIRTARGSAPAKSSLQNPFTKD